jgi:CubicO group peptidase (beta-lactamase class C family)
VAAGDATIDAVPATALDHVRIGSVTKTFTATEVLKLVDAGELALTDAVSTLLPDTAARGIPSSPMSLLRTSSG